MTQTYQVGQVLYVISSGKTSVVPVQVIEEIKKKTMRGEEVSYIVRWGKDGSETDIGRIDGEIFESPEKVLEVLTTRSAEAIKNIVNKAVTLAKELYAGSFESNSQEHAVIITKSQDKIQLPDGTVANIKLPDILK